MSMTAILFALQGAAEPQPESAAEVAFQYDPLDQIHVVVDADGRRSPVIDERGSIHPVAGKTVQTWCRDPYNSGYKIKDDTETVGVW